MLISQDGSQSDNLLQISLIPSAECWKGLMLNFNLVKHPVDSPCGADCCFCNSYSWPGVEPPIPHTPLPIIKRQTTLSRTVANGIAFFRTAPFPTIRGRIGLYADVRLLAVRAARGVSVWQPKHTLSAVALLFL